MDRTKTYAFRALMLLTLAAASLFVPQAAFADATLSAVSVSGGSLEIASDASFTYTIYKPDPYMVVLELPGVNKGTVEPRLISSQEPIAEVKITGADSAPYSTRVEILLTEPREVEAVFEGNSLKVSAKGAAASAQPSAPAAQPSVFEPSVPAPSAMAETPAPVVEETPPPAFGGADYGVPPPAPPARTDYGAADVLSSFAETEEPSATEPSARADEAFVPAKTLAPATRLNEVSFDYADGTMKLVFASDGKLNPKIYSLDRKIVIDLPGVAMDAPFPPRILEPVKSIRFGAHNGNARVVVDLIEDVGFAPTTIDQSLVIAFEEWKITTLTYMEPTSSEEAAEPKKEAPDAVTISGFTKDDEGLTVASLTETSLGPTKQQYKGKMITLDFQDADIVPIFRLLGEVSGYNIVINPGVTGKITLQLNNVPWDQALDIILDTFNLGKEADGNIMTIAPMSVFRQLKEEEERMKEAQVRVEPLEQQVIRVNYAEAKSIQTAIEEAKIKGARGSITVDGRMNTLILKDSVDNLKKMRDLIKIMDVSVPQVMIEAKIVEVSTDFERTLGIRWGGHTVASHWPPVAGDFSVNTPINQAGSGTSISGGGMLNLSIGTADKTLVELSLEAYESVGKLKKISNPKILTMDNNSASIQQGVSIPVQTTTAEGSTTQFINANLNLSVKPRITPDGYVQMEVAAANDTPVEVGGAVGINRQSVNTKAIVKTGDTLVLGGIYTSEEREQETRVPGLGSIPIIGWLFSHKSTGPNPKKELLIFITPTIVQRSETL